jgi:hypothetical protein
MHYYYEIAEKVQGNRRHMAKELGAHLDNLSCKLAQFSLLESDSKEYCALMRIYLVSLKQFDKLLPPVSVDNTDALTAFNAN